MKLPGILVLLVVLAAISGCISGEKPADYSTARENSDAGIRISLTYLPDEAEVSAFEVKVTAHNDYNDDFENNSYLREPGGKIYQPLTYEGTRGHHATGTLRFPKTNSTSFEIVIRDVAGVKERVFKW